MCEFFGLGYDEEADRDFYSSHLAICSPFIRYRNQRYRIG